MIRKQKSHLLLYMIVSILSCGIFLAKEVFASDSIKISSSNINKLHDDNKKEDLLKKRTIKTIYQGPIRFPNDPDENKKIKWISKNHEAVVTRYVLPYDVKRLKTFNSNLMVLQYINIKGVHKDYYLDRPFYKAVEEGNLFWRDKHNSLVQNKHYKWYLVDFQKSEWADVIIRIMGSDDERFNMNTYDGIMFDDTRLTWTPSLNRKPKGYDPKKAYAAYLKILKKMSDTFAGKQIIFNGYRYMNNKDEIEKGLSGTHFMAVANGISFETFTRHFSGRYYTKQQVFDQIYDVAAISAQKKKSVFIVDVGKKDDYKSRLFSLSTFLIIYGTNTYYKYVATDVDHPLQYFPEYDLELGKPIEPFSQAGKIFSRRFEKGVVFVNLSNKNIDLNDTGFTRKLMLKGGGEWDEKGSLEWQKMDRIIIPSKSGAIVKK